MPFEKHPLFIGPAIFSLFCFFGNPQCLQVLVGQIKCHLPGITQNKCWQRGHVANAYCSPKTVPKTTEATTIATETIPIKNLSVDELSTPKRTANGKPTAGPNISPLTFSPRRFFSHSSFVMGFSVSTMIQRLVILLHRTLPVTGRREPVQWTDWLAIHVCSQSKVPAPTRPQYFQVCHPLR